MLMRYLIEKVDYSDWTFVGKVGFHIRIEAKHKQSFLEHLVQLGNLNWCMAKHNKTLVNWVQNIPAGLMVRVMDDLAVDQIRLTGFRMKARVQIDIELIFGEGSGHLGHNNWTDISTYHNTNNITLFRPLKPTLRHRTLSNATWTWARIWLSLFWSSQSWRNWMGLDLFVSCSCG